MRQEQGCWKNHCLRIRGWLGLATASHQALISPNRSNPTCLLKSKTVASALCICLSSELEGKPLMEKNLEGHTLNH